MNALAVRQMKEMDFGEFKELFQSHVQQMLEGQNFLFVADVDKDKLWETYLESFPPGTNEVFRERREFDCSCCRQFIKNFGNVVVLKDNKHITIWDFQTGDYKFQPVIDALSNLVKSAPIKDVFLTKEKGIGTDSNKERMENGEVITWEHFRVDLPKRFVTSSNKSIGSLLGEYRDSKNVFQRSLEEISRDALESVLDLISQKSLYKGEEWRDVLNKFLSLQDEYKNLPQEQKNNFCWSKSTEVGGAISRLRNHSIGVLLQDITNGVELDDAVRRYEKIVAPTNYKRPKAIFTKKMVEQAQQKVKELGLEESLGRRHATLEDITVNNILFANKDAAKKMAGNVFEELQQEVSVNPKKFNKVEEVSIDHFVENILPKATNIEVLLENKHESNLVSLIAPQNSNSPSLFKWGNGFSWAYNGNITDSMKERVKAKGGNVEGVLRFSIQWNDDGKNNNDFDAHCIEPNGNEIYYARKRNSNTTGNLDVDITNPKYQCPDGPAVENITWTNEGKMKSGTYHFFVHNYSHNGGRTGFSAEIEFDGQIYRFESNKELRQHEKVTVAKIKYSPWKGIEVIESLPSTTSTKEVWYLQTNQFHPVSVMMYSPNYWDGQKGVGHKHYFFMLNGCKNEDRPNGFFNEFLKEDFQPHKRVFEALGSKMRVEQSDNQLSGLGFSSTKRNSVVCKVEGSFTRTIKVNF
jgi:hypothetical protein